MGLLLLLLRQTVLLEKKERVTVAGVTGKRIDASFFPSDPLTTAKVAIAGHFHSEAGLRGNACRLQ
ncbi:hypothetical protein B5P45_01645 [Phyllobacterium zundukense]|uniref:Uncharacterized protein n=1 Tax=Phyllobacterium zundukense TaxID=1867719 RepID=A0A2N9W462_9HYPH|nr:hypothetical protein BLM14_10435 [Phyllobacterium zundukense]PIO46530.1 hypothetical protein B5P45_01645 [Phyllobacterium zundukense]